MSVVHYSQSIQENLGTFKVLVTEGICGEWVDILQKLKKNHLGGRVLRYSFGFPFENLQMPTNQIKDQR